MDYPTWPYFYQNGISLAWYNHHHYGDEYSCSGDDIARLKAGQRA